MQKEIVTLISTLTGFTIGTKLQPFFRTQASPPRCVLISFSGGGQVVPDLRDQIFPTVQALSRSPSYGEALADIETVYAALHGSAGWNMPGQDGGPNLIAMTVDALQAPAYLGPDANGLHEFTVNFIFRIEEATCGCGEAL